ncbi:hypothetical protein Efla_007054 [Eimeria flavescens]
MGCSCRANYKGPGVGIWALALALEFAVGTLMIFMGANFNPEAPEGPFGLKEFNEDITKMLTDGNAWTVVNALGWLHLLIAAVCGVFAVLGLFVCGIFLCPLCILGWIQTLFCVASTLATAIFLRGYLNEFSDDSGGHSIVKSGDIFFARMHSGALLAASVLSFVSAVLMSRAQRVSSGESVPGTFMMVVSMGLFAAIGALMGAGGGGVKPTPTFAALWVLLTIIGAILMNIRGCCCTKACNVLMIILFGVGAGLALITTGVMAHIYLSVLRDQGEKLDFAHLFLVMDRGMGLVAAAVLSLAGLVMALLATFYSARSLLCCGPGVSSS